MYARFSEGLQMTTKSPIEESGYARQIRIAQEDIALMGGILPHDQIAHAKKREAIIGEMIDALTFALRFWKYTGGCAYINGQYKTPINWFAEVLEKVEVTFDKKDLEALHWPAKERRKYFADKAKKKGKKNDQ